MDNTTWQDQKTRTKTENSRKRFGFLRLQDHDRNTPQNIMFCGLFYVWNRPEATQNHSAYTFYKSILQWHHTTRLTKTAQQSPGIASTLINTYRKPGENGAGLVCSRPPCGGSKGIGRHHWITGDSRGMIEMKGLGRGRTYRVARTYHAGKTMSGNERISSKK